MTDCSRREFLALVGTAAIATRVLAASRISVGYAAITWGGDDEKAIEDVAAVGYKGIQLRASVLTKFGDRPAALRDLLKQRGLTFAVLSSGNLSIDPAVEREQLALHRQHAMFVRDSGGQFIQVIDERPKGRPVTKDDYSRVGQLLTALGKQTKEVGVPLVYHHHMNSTGEKPQEIDAVLDAADPKHVGLLFDIAHYQQGGGDPVAAIRRYRDWIKVVHLKDVTAITESPGYQFVELGHGRVNVKGCVAALKDIGFSGWAIVELDRVPDPNGSPKSSAISNREYVVHQLGLTL
jgi:inosose dehydratase